MRDLMSSSLVDLYAGYYASRELGTKRALAAADSVDHMQLVRPGSLGKILDVGAGNGSVLVEATRRGLVQEATALEVSASGLEKMQKLEFPQLKEVLPFDGYRIPFVDKTFDTAICIHVMEHVEHERMLLKEIGRVARDVLIEVPLEGGLRGRTNYTYGHINYYTPLSFRALLETSGLTVVKAKVLTSSSAYEQTVHGSVGGRVRHVIRNTLLRTLGPSAAELMTYLLTVHCRA